MNQQRQTSMLTSQDTERWLTLRARTEGSFIYAVISTGVYCRPACPARLPRRDNVRFFDNALAAEADGFRPCKRCLPDQGGLRERQQEWVTRACRLIEAAPEQLDLDSLAAAIGSSPSHLHRLFKQLLGCTPKQYADAQRAERTRTALQDGGSVTEAFYDSGFNSSSRFYTASETLLGMKPKRFRAGGIGEQLRFAVGECHFGSILVAASTEGVCWVSLGDEPDSLLKEFQHRFHAAELIGADGDFERIVATVVAAIEGRLPPSDLALDIRGTVFQLKVWEELRKIPRGSAISYAALAEQIGQPGAVRAVASACANNQIAVLIPCHRVVRLDGALAGYRWGLERKAKLLEAERGLQRRSQAI